MEDWKTYTDVHRTVPLLCYICLLGFIGALRISLPFIWQWKKSFECTRSFVSHTLKSIRFEQSPSWLGPFRAGLSQRRIISWELNRPHKEERQDMFPFWLCPPSFPPILYPSFLLSLCLSILSSLSLSSFILLLPVITVLWSGPRRRIRVGPAGSLTWGEPGTSN